MKKLIKTLSIVLVATLALTLFSACGPKTPTPQATKLDYEVKLNASEDGYILKSYTGEDKRVTKITVPSEYDGKPIVELGNGLFRPLYGLEEVELPTSVKKLGSSVFSGLKKLKTVNLGNVETFGANCFDGCDLLESIDLSSAKTLGTACFSKCKKLSSLTFPATLEQIPEKCFASCEKLVSVDFGTGVKKVEKEAFSGCGGISQIDMSKLTHIGYESFKNCDAITSVDLASIKELGEYAFRDCNRLTEATINGECILMYKTSFNACTMLSKVYVLPSTERWIIVGVHAQYGITNTTKWPHWMSPDAFADPEATATGHFDPTIKEDKDYWAKEEYVYYRDVHINVPHLQANKNYNTAEECCKDKYK